MSDPSGPRRRRGSRRVRREATDGVAEEQRPALHEAPESQTGRETDEAPGQGSDEWWQQQRPPHWA